MYKKLVLIFTIWCMSSADCLLLEPSKQCVPTDMVRGPCHVCICSTEGVFHCRAEPCIAEGEQVFRVSENECQPDFMYNQDTVFCTCTATGQWRSENCRNLFQNLHSKTSFMSEKLQSNILCTPHTLYLIDCNICKCEPNGYINVASCTNRNCPIGHIADRCKPGDFLRLDDQICACSDINYYIDRLCLSINHKIFQEIDIHEITKITEADLPWRKHYGADNAKCEPNKIYTVDCNTCTCVEEAGLKCTEEICEEKTALRKRKNTAFDSLPKLDSLDSACIPGRVYRYRCNTCVCTRNGAPTCTTMVCLEEFVMDFKDLRAAMKQATQDI